MAANHAYSSNDQESFRDNLLKDTINTAGPKIRKTYSKKKGLSGKELEDKVREVSNFMVSCQIDDLRKRGNKYFKIAIKTSKNGSSGNKSVSAAIKSHKSDIIASGMSEADYVKGHRQASKEVAQCTHEKIKNS